jgi:hypothetical protein
LLSDRNERSAAKRQRAHYFKLKQSNKYAYTIADQLRPAKAPDADPERAAARQLAT